ncbi:hypothetical protein ES676_05020 [Bizionia saleffrena]|uniref:Uncharacterized protein n=1 Tax=Bizionia saleffrena TaxID=291189 RepID=A0A8H2LI12_9FLAO|nr:hypothetical protein [Bizionia saleffrena]TYB76709.1 hypothetical protein ES676_05020 [Bizionia saleffrena]
MTAQEFKVLALHLEAIAPHIPERWGAIQNDKSDAKINMFRYASFEALEIALKPFDDGVKTYFKKRWFLWKCAQCDEYLFYKHTDVLKNPDRKDQNWDFEFFGEKRLQFDLKGTVIPKAIKQRLNPTESPSAEAIINFFYTKQSRGIRDNIQNRLFVIHCPFGRASDNLLRVNFQAKALIYRQYIHTVKHHDNYPFFVYKSKLVDILYLNEQIDGTVCYEFAALDRN